MSKRSENMRSTGEQSRRLRPREGAGGCRPTVDNPRGLHAPSKRAAGEDASRGPPAPPVQQPKKRPPLLNLTNRSAPQHKPNALSNPGLNQIAASKGKARRQCTGRDSEIQKGVPKSTVSRDPGQPSVLAKPPNNYGSCGGFVSSHSEGSVSSSGVLEANAEGPGLSDSSKTSEVTCADSNAAAIASLERRTLQNLYISKHSKSKGVQVHLLEESCPAEARVQESEVVDIDTDHSDPQMCASYACDIYDHLRNSEKKRRPTTDYMEVVQQEINSSMRAILIDWLVEVAEEYRLVPETLYLTVSCIDRYLSSNVATRQRLQLLGISCMLIASKHEEICPPQVEEFCYITDNTYFREEVLEMERQVLGCLHFEINVPTIKVFLGRFIRAAQFFNKSLQLEFLANYLAELTLMEYSFLQYLPSLIAASVVFLAKLTFDPTTRPWNTTMQHYTRYGPRDLRECVKALHELQCNTKNCNLFAIRDKYRQHKFKSVSTLVPPVIIPSELFMDLDAEVASR